MDECIGFSRRRFLIGMAGTAGVAAAGATLIGAATANAATDRDGTKVTPSEALHHLKAGSLRWKSGHLEHRDYTPPGHDIIHGQWPFAAILSCADSRVNPESVFDVRQGNLFNVRNAGNIADEIAIGSLEYAVAVLKVPAILVLGHGSCGAVVATQKAVTTGTMPGGDIDAIVDLIRPAIERLPHDHTRAEAIRSNVQNSAQTLLYQSATIAKAVEAGKLRIAKAVYIIGSREVDFFAHYPAHAG